MVENKNTDDPLDNEVSLVYKIDGSVMVGMLWVRVGLGLTITISGP